MNSDDCVLSIADALGLSYIELAPTDEAHFDPATVGVLIAIWVAGAVAEGIRDGIKEASASGTDAVLTATAKQIGNHLLPNRIRKAFMKPPNEDQLDTEMKTVSEQLNAAHEAASGLGPETIDEIAAIAGLAVRNSLQPIGLSERAGHKLQESIEVNVKVVLSYHSGRVGEA